MKRPKKEDYDFNDHWEVFRFTVDLGIYADYLEGINNHLVVKINDPTEKVKIIEIP